MAKVPFIGEAYSDRSPNINAQRTVNLFPTVDNHGGKSVVALHGRPGLDLFSYLTIYPMRGVYAASNGVLYAVAGGKFYSVTAAGVETEKGTLNTSAGRVSFADNGSEVCVVDGTTGYIFDIGADTFTAIADEDFPTSPDMVTFIDGYFIVNKNGTGVFYISGLYDGTAWDALDVATAEAHPDNVLALANDHRELWLFGDYSTEVWVNTGNASFPFERIQGAVIEEGIAAKWSVAQLDNSLFWLGKNKNGQGRVMRANGYQPQVISTRAIEEAISEYTDISDAWACALIWKGHAWYVLSFPTADATWVYDATTGMWHEWSSLNAAGEFKRFIGNTYCFAYGEHLFGDYEDGDIYAFNADTYTDNGEPIVRTRRAQHIANENKNLFMSRLQIDMEMGTGDSNYSGDEYQTYVADGSYYADGTILAGSELIPGGSVNPQAMLRWSDDGGHTFGNEHWVTIGKQGEYKKRAIWRRLGRSRDRVFELNLTDPVKVVLIDAYAEITGGRH